VTDRVAKPVRFEALRAVLERRVLCPLEGESAGH
jgi:two-component system, sensor histidine kinase LadS